MPLLHLFYPENDLALAHGTANYTPPAAARRLRDAGMTLPLWYGRPGDMVCVNGVNAAWFDSMCSRFDLRTAPFDHCWRPDLRPAPWGWSPASRRLLMQQGVPAKALPDNDRIERLKQLSHRRTAIALHQLIAPLLDFAIAPAAAEVSDMAQLDRLLAAGTPLMAKLPWSSSGRGLCDSSRCTAADFRRMAGGMVSNQGSVMIEPLYRRVIDFAMLYECAGGRAAFAGYSVFSTEGLGKYTGNIVASDDYLLQQIGRYIPTVQVEAVRDAVARGLAELTAGVYDGPVGVDMFVASTADGYLLDATVEINFRRTMGMVAHRLCEQLMTPGAVGHFAVTPATTVCDPVIDGHRLSRGTVNLTPPGHAFNFLLTAE